MKEDRTMASTGVDRDRHFTSSGHQRLPNASTAESSAILPGTAQHQRDPTDPGKLTPLSANGRVLGDSQADKAIIKTYNVFPLTSSAAYLIKGQLLGTNIPLLLDRGASISLLRKDVWDHATTLPPSVTLQPWSGQTLVSAKGSPLTVHGHATIPVRWAHACSMYASQLRRA